MSVMIKLHDINTGIMLAMQLKNKIAHSDGLNHVDTTRLKRVKLGAADPMAMAWVLLQSFDQDAVRGLRSTDLRRTLLAGGP